MKLNSADPYAAAVKDIFLADHLTLAVAESVTCGHLQAAFSHIEDTTQFFQGGITAYNLGQKARLLRVEPIAAERSNCVSEAVAVQMARAAARLFLADVGVGITGYASEVPELGIRSLFAHFAVVKHGRVLLCDTITAPKKEPAEVQQQYCIELLKRMADVLKKGSI